MIRVENLSVVFNRGTPLEKTAITRIDLSLRKGEFVSLIGSNGAGKSTLLAAIAGDVAATTGRIAIHEADITGWPPARRATRIARVFQDPLAGSCAELTIAENLAIASARGTRRGFHASLDAGRLELFRSRAAELGLGLETRLNDRMGLLSGGQRQALALVMATLAPCDVLLLDEHTAALDPGMAEFVSGLTRRLVAAHGLTTLMVTHSMRQALDLGTRTIMLHEGRIILDVAGEQRSGLGVDDLVAMFRRVRGGEALDDDALITS